ncbi:WWOX, partial [Symbiodinium pilosum]
NAKLASLTFALELERRLRNAAENDGITSHAINPNAVLTDFQKSLSASSERSAMSYLPPVWIAGKVFGFLGSRFREMTMRSIQHGASAIVHVATLPALQASGGGLFDDTETAFTKCGRTAAYCGRVPESWLPSVTLDEQ